jgi:hypothetical protein
MTNSNPSSSTPRALIIRANGDWSFVPNTGLACLQEAVGGYIEAVHLGRNAIMYVNEEGLLIGDIAPNLIATKIALWHNPGLCHPIVGDVIISGFDPETGEDCNLPPALAKAAIDALLDLAIAEEDPSQHID